MDILINKAYKDYDYISRYTSFPYYYNTKDKKYIYGFTSQLNQDVTYTLHKVKPNETLDTIALDYYNNPTFYWVLAYFNNIQDCYEPLEIDQILKIPTLSELTFIN